VTGVDIAPNMLREARSALPEASFFEGRAEALPFADAAFGLVICAQAFHWFDGPKAYAQIARVLVSGGAIAAFWKNALDDDPVNKLTDDLEREMSHGKADAVQKAVVAHLREEWEAAPFADRRRLDFAVSLPFTIDSYIGYQSSRETLRHSLGERRHHYLQLLRSRLEALAPGGAFEVAAREHLFLGRRRARA
jgi:SAM-dependent methyltransferase